MLTYLQLKHCFFFLVCFIRLGVLWVMNHPIHGSPEVINRLQELGKRVFFVTNNSTKTRAGFLEKAQKLGYQITENGILSTAYAAAKYLENRQFNKKVFLIGSSGIAEELENVGIKLVNAPGPDVIKTNYLDILSNDLQLDGEVGAVVVGFDEHISFPKLMKAATYLNKPDVLFIATNTDERFPSKFGVVPGSGTMVRAVETCAERKATIMGKPCASICESLIVNEGIVPERTLMIGDRCNTDILLGTNCGFQTLLVGTGVHHLHDVHGWRKSKNDDDKKLIPDVYLQKLGDLLPYLQ